MKKLSSRFMAIAMLILLSFPLSACDQNAGKISVKEVYAFATAPNAKTGAVFMTIKNKTGMDDKLIEARSDVAEITEIHQNFIDPDDGQMMMRKVKSIDIESKGKAMLEPTGYHIMLINLKEQLIEDDLFPVTLKFESGYETIVNAVVTPAGQKPSKHHKDDGHDH